MVRRAAVTRPRAAGAREGGGFTAGRACGSGLDGGSGGRSLVGLPEAGSTSPLEKLSGLSSALNPGRGAAGRLVGGGFLVRDFAEGGLAATF